MVVVCRDRGAARWGPRLQCQQAAGFSSADGTVYEDVQKLNPASEGKAGQECGQTGAEHNTIPIHFFLTIGSHNPQLILQMFSCSLSFSLHGLVVLCSPQGPRVELIGSAGHVFACGQSNDGNQTRCINACSGQPLLSRLLTTRGSHWEFQSSHSRRTSLFGLD